MSKNELIDFIMEINRSAKQEFLSGFSTDELDEYLENLLAVDLESLALCA